MRAVWSPPFIYVSAKQLWHHEGMSSEAKIRSERGNDIRLARHQGVTGIPNICVLFPVWPLSSNVLALNLTDSGQFCGPHHPSTRSKTSSWLWGYIHKVLTRKSIHTHTLTQGLLRFHTPPLALSLQTCTQICCGQAAENHILKLTLCIWHTCNNNICSRMWCVSAAAGREERYEYVLFSTPTLCRKREVDFCDSSLHTSPPVCRPKIQSLHTNNRLSLSDYSHITSFVWSVKCRPRGWVTHRGGQRGTNNDSEANRHQTMI